MNASARVELESAYCLIQRPYSDSRSLLELFTANYGRLTVIIRVAKKASKRQCSLFQPLFASWQGKGALKTLTAYEYKDTLPGLGGTALYCGFYLNELITRLLPVNDAHQEIFQAYEKALKGLRENPSLEYVLRVFELSMLQHLGFGASFEYEANHGERIVPHYVYRYVVEQGFVQAHATQTSAGPLFTGNMLLNVHENKALSDEDLCSLKTYCRMVLKPLLGNKPLNSRAFFQ